MRNVTRYHVATLVLFTALLFCQPSLSRSGEGPIAAAEELIQQGLYLEAFKALDAADPSDPASRQLALKMRADILSHFLDKYDEALVEYDAAIAVKRRGEDAGGAHFLKGMILYELGRLPEAKAEFDIYGRNFPKGRRMDTARFMYREILRLEKAGEKPAPRELPKLGTYKTVRVALQRKSSRATIGCTGKALTITAQRGAATQASQARFSVRDGKVENAETGGSDREWLVTAQSGHLTVGGKPYRGKILVKPYQGALLVTNLVDIEDYLRGVVPSEMPASWPAEALKAQAIAARTYALFQISKRADYAFDVDPTIYYQVYGGVRAEHPATNRAIDATAGQILVHGGRPIVAYFSSANGGYTETAGNVWGIDFDYLKSVPDAYDPRGYSGWSETFSRGQVQAKLERWIGSKGHLRDLRVSSATRAGRVKQVTLECSGGPVNVEGEAFRKAMGRSKFISWVYQPRVNGEKVTFHGKGFGHAVGMSQHGAKIQARDGRSFEEILAFYYRGAGLVRVKAK